MTDIAMLKAETIIEPSPDKRCIIIIISYQLNHMKCLSKNVDKSS